MNSPSPARFCARIVFAAALVGLTSAPLPAATLTKYSLSDGPLICLRKLKEKLGANAEVSYIFTRFFTEAGMSDSTRTDGPPGGLDVCTANYRSQTEPKKLFKIEMDSSTGEFLDPEPIHITVIGDAEKFQLDEILFPIAKVNIDAIEKGIKTREAQLAEKYSKSQFTTLFIKREAGYAVTTTAMIAGLLKSNDIAKDTLIDFMLDGRFD